MDYATNPMMSSPNRLKVGLFGLNVIPVQTLVPELYQPTWENALRVGLTADRMGLEVILPPARWKGYLDDHFEHQSNEILDMFTFVAAMAQATSYSSVVATTHAPMAHPVLISKQTATVDQISKGRLALNVVGGWNRREFDVFGIDLVEHSQRYVYLQEWLDLVRRLWTETRDFDYESAHFRLKGAVSRPQPVQKPGIPVINAGLSPVGNRFAAQNAEVGFIVLSGTDPEAWAKQASDFRTLAKSFGRDIKLWTTLSVTIRDSDAEAHEYEHYFSEEMLDQDAINGMLTTMMKETPLEPGSPQYQSMRRTLISGGGYGVTGSPETVAKQLADMSAAGIDGVAMKCVDFGDTLERFERQVLPILESMGIRQPFVQTQAGNARQAA